LRPVKIAGLATYVPPRVLSNFDLEKMVETSDEWILQRTGIRERHIVDPGVATSDIAAPAACQAIAEAGLTPNDIGFIVVGTTTPDTIFPSTACTLQGQDREARLARSGARARFTTPARLSAPPAPASMRSSLR
jgi:3-oxoacyl-[acyl-carrier-protein] synthase-3